MKMKMTEEERAEKIKQSRKATERAKKVLKPGDKIRSRRCPGRLVTYRFSHWDGSWIVSASGIDDIAAVNIDRLNGQPISFKSEESCK